jgi:NTP pyrophosphatase (non-canonical NTP hydrolase)
MKLNEYQAQATSTAIYPGQGTINGIVYCALKLNGEAGEVAEKVGKALRDANGQIDIDRRVALIKELGDVMWYVAALAKELSVSLDDVAEINIDKLARRKENGTLGGDGDNR